MFLEAMMQQISSHFSESDFLEATSSRLLGAATVCCERTASGRRHDPERRWAHQATIHVSATHQAVLIPVAENVINEDRCTVSPCRAVRA